MLEGTMQDVEKDTDDQNNTIDLFDRTNITLYNIGHYKFGSDILRIKADMTNVGLCV